mmetsp:Transcript_8562/g.17725  ORF Transcript_8562/g.17725 Transcript_8562/m.17725 type:complete len:94 (-) Transcript_8562:134-415(-)
MDAITAFPSFLMANIGWSLVFTFAQILFWVYGFPALHDYGYDDANKLAGSGGFGSIPSGPSGSGVGIISTILMVVGTLSWGSSFLAYKKPSAE